MLDLCNPLHLQSAFRETCRTAAQFAGTLVEIMKYAEFIGVYSPGTINKFCNTSQHDASHAHALLFPLSGRMQKCTHDRLRRIWAGRCVMRTYMKRLRGCVYDTPSSTRRASESTAVTE